MTDYHDDCINLDSTIANFILPRLRWFRDNFVGAPMKDDGEGSPVLDDRGMPVALTEDEYREELDAMIRSFEIVAEGYYVGSDRIFESNEEIGEFMDTYEEGMRLFARRFSSLWL